MNRFLNLLTGALMASCCLTLCAAWAEPALRLPSEASGTQQVMKLLNKVNVTRTDQNARQGVSDILDMKSQIYSQNSLLRPGGTGLTVSGARLQQRDSRPRHQKPAARYRTPYHYKH